MRVNIGPYPNTIRVYKWHDKWLEYNHKIPYWKVEEENYTRLDIFIERLIDVVQWGLDVTINKINRPRKIKIRIDNYDIWNMDHTLALIILPMLKKLKEKGHGSPHIDDEDVTVELRSTSAPPKVNEWDVDGLHHQRWQWALDQMIWAFEQILDDDEGHNNYYVDGKFDMVKYKEYNNKIQSCLILFGKHFRSLWD